ncbi:MAG: hypothetical protein K2H30_06320 [Clostridia bacterium]|nr:hypothetical protein [Clostridia bacterium]
MLFFALVGSKSFTVDDFGNRLLIMAGTPRTPNILFVVRRGALPRVPDY